MELSNRSAGEVPGNNRKYEPENKRNRAHDFLSL